MRFQTQNWSHRIAVNDPREHFALEDATGLKWSVRGNASFLPSVSRSPFAAFCALTCPLALALPEEQNTADHIANGGKRGGKAFSSASGKTALQRGITEQYNLSLFELGRIQSQRLNLMVMGLRYYSVAKLRLAQECIAERMTKK